MLIEREFPFAQCFGDQPLHQMPPVDAMMDVVRAAERMVQALDLGQKVFVCGDYDVDGTSACALLDRFFRHYGLPLDIHIPNRLTEGYGLSRKGVDTLAERGARVIVTVDNGIAALDACARARELGIDVIVTDHHEPQSQLPDAFAIVNPKRPGCPFPYKHLSGVGVAFYLCMALRRCLGKDPSKGRPIVLRSLLDLVAVGTIADVCPLTGLNHILTRTGLAVLQDHVAAGSSPGLQGPRPGLAALAQVCGLMDSGPLSSESVAFQLGPRLNAAGRLGAAWGAYRLMATDDAKEAAELASRLNQENLERRTLEREAATTIVSRLGEQMQTSSPERGLVLFDAQWHPGIVGIVAARCVEKYYRPTIVFTLWDGVLKGSGRSTDDLDLFALLAPHSHRFLAFGGHAKAIGLSMEPSQLDAFRDLFLGLLEEGHSLSPQPSLAALRIDGCVSVSELSLEAARVLAQLEPFGAGNPRPTLALKNARITNLTPMGRNLEDGHCFIHIEDHPLDGGRPEPASPLRITAFGQRHQLEAAGATARPLHLAVTLGESQWKGKSRPEIRLVDFGPADASP